MIYKYYSFFVAYLNATFRKQHSIFLYYMACLHASEHKNVKAKKNDTHFEIAHFDRCLSGYNINEDTGAKKLHQLLQKDTVSQTLYFGYPTYIEGSSQGEISPILLFQICWNTKTKSLTVDFNNPQINLSALNLLLDLDAEEVERVSRNMNNKIQGMHANAAVRILKEEYPNWLWLGGYFIESSVLEKKSIHEFKKSCIYNTAVIILGQGSPFTDGLKKDLAAMCELPKLSFQNTALGDWINGKTNSEGNSAPNYKPILISPAPLNKMQRAATQAALYQKLTVITGPPGTGKSQCVISIMLSALNRGERVLFVSKNNQAVHVVEQRILKILPINPLLRVGSSNEQKKNFAKFALDAIQFETIKFDNAAYDQTCKEILETESLIKEVTKITIDLGKFKIEHHTLIQKHGATLRNHALTEIMYAHNDVKHLQATITQALKANDSLLAKLGRLFRRGGKHKQFRSTIAELDSCLSVFDIKLPEVDPEEKLNRIAWLHAIKKLVTLRKELVIMYHHSSRKLELKQLPSEESLKQRMEDLGKKLSHLAVLKIVCKSRSRILDKIRLRQSKADFLNKAKKWRPRNIKREYIKLFEHILSDTTSKKKDDLYKSYKAAFKSLSPAISCWATTSLSVPRQLLFEAGSFDLVIFDEASQSDIASALPILFRANRAVIIKRQLR